MQYYLAPMEGITTYIYRNAYAEYFGGIDKYFTPFLSPNADGKLSPREYQDLAAEHIAGYPFHGRKIIIHHNNLPNPLFILCICLPSFIYSLHPSAIPYLFSASVCLNPLLHPGKRIPNHFIPAVFVKSP